MTLLGVLAVAGIVAAIALGAQAPPAPTITASPTNPSASTSASFTYTDSQAITKFQCQLDASGFADCGTTRPSTKNYPGPLAPGSHTFQVRAVSGSQTSSATSYGWTIDTTPPHVVSIVRVGPNPTNAASVSWTVTFSEGVTGVDSGDFSLASSGLGGTPAVTGVTGSGSAYTVSASAGSGTGSLGLNLVDNDSITDAAGNRLGGTGNGNGNYNGQAYTIDRSAPPVPTITSGPSGVTNQASASFAFSDSEGGVSFLCKLDGGSFLACTSPTSYSGLGDGSHTFSVEARDAAGNTSAPATRSWTVDATSPPRPTVTNGPTQKWGSSTVTFTFTDPEAGVTFSCAMDLVQWQPCTSPKTYYFMSAGTHEFDVRAIDAAGNVSDYDGWKWSENGVTGTGQPFTISGSLSTPLYPGSATQYLNLALTNPNSVTIYVSSLSVSLSVSAPNANLQHLCSATNDFVLTQFSGGYPIILPASSTRTLSQLGYGQSQQPSIRMPDTNLNQDGCKGATLTFTYTGSAQS